MTRWCFLLGGGDLEMTTIRALVAATLGEEAIRDRGLTWGARLSDYAEDLGVLPPETVPVLVELALDIEPPPGAVVIDHHNEDSGSDRPTSLEQVFALLGLPPSAWTRAFALVAANDRGHVPALRALGASAEEIEAIRRADRQAQGITPAEERDGETATARRRPALDGAVTLVDLPHARTATVTDRLATLDPPPEAVLIRSPTEVNFFGPGPAVRALDAALPGGWHGGDLPRAGFWGRGEPLPETEALLAILADPLAKKG
ncbi:hypothetical protein [Phaeospirillum tilakii]|uniref:Uncharacterized protein n=1 Tax=Phaeospirillum tilakii TaxID=741673 RepID=A0ABW5C8B9_9PROT